MIRAHGPVLHAWLAHWRLRQRYHRYSVEGLEKLDGPEPALLVGYHGRPVAYDICLLSVALYDRLGYLPHGILDRNTSDIPLVGRSIVDGLGCVTGNDDRLRACVAQGEHIVVTPGGASEGLRSARTRYRVHWKRRIGFVRLALEHGLRIVPVAASGVDDTYLGLYDWHALAGRLGVSRHWPLWAGVGPLGLFPFSPPFPVRIRQLIGDPVRIDDLGLCASDDDAALLPAQRRVRDAVQELLVRARS